MLKSSSPNKVYIVAGGSQQPFGRNINNSYEGEYMNISKTNYKYKVHSLKDLDFLYYKKQSFKLKTRPVGNSINSIRFPYTTLDNENLQLLREHLTRVFDFNINRNEGGVRGLARQLEEWVMSSTPLYDDEGILTEHYQSKYLKLKYMYSGESKEYEKWKKNETFKFMLLLDYRLVRVYLRNCYFVRYICTVMVNNRMFEVTIDIYPITSLFYLSMRNIIEYVELEDRDDKFIREYYLTTPQLKKMYKQVTDDLCCMNYKLFLKFFNPSVDSLKAILY